MSLRLGNDTRGSFAGPKRIHRDSCANKGALSFVAFDLFVKHTAFYVGNVIDVGIEIMPMKEMGVDMSSGPAYYERELYNVIRQGRGVPAVPLVLVGVAP